MGACTDLVCMLCLIKKNELEFVYFILKIYIRQDPGMCKCGFFLFVKDGRIRAGLNV